MRILQTPLSGFEGLKDYPFSPHFIIVNNLQMHYVDEGPVKSAPVLLLHGVPSWSYLYRQIIKKIADSGSRVVAPDLIGFGKSDKPADIKSHTYQLHVECITEFIYKVGLKDIILFCHDWGSLIGLRIAALHPDLFSGIIVSNGMLPAGGEKHNPLFKFWKFFARYSPYLPVDLIIEWGISGKLDKEEKRAYRAPFPSLKYKSAIRALPGLVPAYHDDPAAIANRMAWASLNEWNKPLLTVFSNNDPITNGGDEYIQKRIPGTAGQNHIRLDARHFIQEDRSTELSDIIIRFRGKAETIL